MPLRGISVCQSGCLSTNKAFITALSKPCLTVNGEPVSLGPQWHFVSLTMVLINRLFSILKICENKEKSNEVL